ncbi:MAG: hypothetical protein ACFFEF_00705 [Candidatus Thorarchaeota archaeon]
MNEKRAPAISLVTVFMLVLSFFFPLGMQFTISNVTDSEIQLRSTRQISDVPDDAIPLSRAVFVGYDPDSYIDDFAYMAAVPSSIFYYGGNKYVSPLLYTGGTSTEQWLIEDWNEYLAADGGVSQVFSIGDVDKAQIMMIQETLGARVYPQITGTSAAELAAKIAINDWKSSDTVVLALAKDDFAEPTISTGQFSHTFSSPSVQLLDTSTTISTTLPKEFEFTPPSGTGWIEGALNWTGSEIFTHVLKDPLGRSVDYSIYSQVVFERNPALGYVSSPLPLYFWLPMSLAGDWNVTMNPQNQINRDIVINVNVKYHPGFSETISVPQGAKWLNVTATWDNAGTNVHMALIDPTGKMVMWAPAESLLGGAGSKFMNMPYPMTGDWTFIASWVDAVEENNNVQVSWAIESLPSDLQPYLESAANGAVLASLLNAPLLYVDSGSIPDPTRWAINRLGASSAILVDPTSFHSSSLISEITDIMLLSNISTYPMLADWIQSLSGEMDVVLTVPLGTGDELFAPSAYSAAFHGATIFSLCGDDNTIPTRAEETWAPYLVGPEIEIFVRERYNTRAENGWYDERIPNKYSMLESSESVKDFLEARHAYNASAEQSAVIVSPTNLIKVSFDRSLQSHFASGRIPADNIPIAAAMINKAAHHRFLFRTADNSDEALLSLYAYTLNAPFSDNFGNPYTIRQIEDTLAALTDAGFTISPHIGRDAVYQTLASQVGFWSFSTHGTLTEYPTDPPQRPQGLGVFSLRDQDLDYGQESDTESDANGDNLVNPVLYSPENSHHITGTTETLRAAIGNIGSPIVVLTACLLGGSMMPVMLMEHGAVAVTAAPRTVYFRPAGILSILFTEAITDGNTTGDSLAYALRQISQDYTDPLSGDPRDYANQQILFGDPDISLYNPDTHPRIPSEDPTNMTLDGHSPGNGVDSIAGIGQSDYLPQSFTSLGIEYDYYESNNYSEFLMLLDLRTTVVVEPSVWNSLLPTISPTSNELVNYVFNGGTLVIAGINGDVSWLPWGAVFVSGASSGVDYAEPPFSLVSFPNSLSTALDYTGYLSSVSSNLTVVASGAGNIVAAAGIYGYGRIALLTLNPSGTDATDFIENAVSWSNQPALILRSATKNQEIIWEGDRVIITLKIADMTGRGVEGASVSAWINTTSVTVTEAAEGEYTILLNESWTSGKVGMLSLRVMASKAGYDTCSVELLDFFYIRASPWLVIGIVGAGLIAVVVGFQYRKYRRGEPLFRRKERPKSFYKPSKDDSKIKKKEEEERRKRREKEDQEIDPKEFFGV